jgi:hypothetical protein
VADDIIARLNEVWECATYPWQRNAINDAKAEIERLRQRGDNLHTVAIEMPNPRHNLSWLAWRTQIDNALMGWEEARRG